jgi:hypothetical protein
LASLCSKREVHRARDAGGSADDDGDGTATPLVALLELAAQHLAAAVGAGLGAHVLVLTTRADAAFTVPQVHPARWEVPCTLTRMSSSFDMDNCKRRHPSELLASPSELERVI